MNMLCHKKQSAALPAIPMNMEITDKLSVRAIKNGIFIARHTTASRLIRRIQSAEGGTPCFQTELRESCPKTSCECEWADDCKNALVAHWQR